jgi:hypothetical protein
LHDHGITYDDIAKFCLEGTSLTTVLGLVTLLIPYIASEKQFGNEAAFCLDYIIASTQYEAFLGLMADFRSMQEYEFDEDDTAGYSCFRYGYPLTNNFAVTLTCIPSSWPERQDEPESQGESQ